MHRRYRNREFPELVSGFHVRVLRGHVRGVEVPCLHGAVLPTVLVSSRALLKPHVLETPLELGAQHVGELPRRLEQHLVRDTAHAKRVASGCGFYEAHAGVD